MRLLIHSLSCALFLAAGFVSTGAAAVVPSSAVTLRWDANPEADIAGYKVHVGTESGVHPLVIDAGGATAAVLPPVSLGTTYFLAVSAYNSAGVEGPKSEELEVTAAVPAPPGSLTLDLSAPGEMRLRWTHPEAGVAAERFTIYASEDLENWEPVGTVAPDMEPRDGLRHFEFPWAVADRPRQFFRVGASNAFGESR
jgi:hypothetical protein